MYGSEEETMSRGKKENYNSRLVISRHRWRQPYNIKIENENFLLIYEGEEKYIYKKKGKKKA